MSRLYVVITIALLIFLQSNCFTFENGALINRCGLWQRFSGNAIVISFKEEQFNLNKTVLQNVVPVISSNLICSGANSNNFCTTSTSSPTITLSAPHIYAISGMSMTIPTTTSTITMSTIGPIDYKNWQRNRR